MVNWDNFLTSQPTWIEALLEDVQFYTMEDGWPDFYEIAEELNKHRHLICVSDRSVIFSQHESGWVLATPAGKRLVGSNSLCNGRGNTLRAEGAGHSSRLRTCVKCESCVWQQDQIVVKRPTCKLGIDAPDVISSITSVCDLMTWQDLSVAS
ncbi:hypothetical protein FRACYDRAFT_243821 [Fragilariopsis cylindrus CCMP1102]|uniref:Uncharacterized protein n=1 Tax=Fragilariopsis cylindrus CCMP1102 TaxID=635003 RepID=A0A1E7F320_9STRA|nr:hypothetical protein FRACYDRAFT_243821 [Fragilariopsis cylindrus CCMP1102]|eukprot:OEU12570.1 hypothetical protein FRACYDRAFT_243821 [Fragilariopsis cylindrus CCMP1102]